jgi:hypothetical protein
MKLIWRPGLRSQYCDSVGAGRFGDRIPVGARFSAPVKTGPGAPPSLLWNAYSISFSRVNRPGRAFEHLLPSCSEIKERVELYLCSPLWAFMVEGLWSRRKDSFTIRNWDWTEKRETDMPSLLMKARNILRGARCRVVDRDSCPEGSVTLT